MKLVGGAIALCVIAYERRHQNTYTGMKEAIGKEQKRKKER
ncbi:hypothetical protein [Grimontia sedimenti]|nr:hypothetical protein [Grimontia sedimenti]